MLPDVRRGLCPAEPAVVVSGLRPWWCGLAPFDPKTANAWSARKSVTLNAVGKPRSKSIRNGRAEPGRHRGNSELLLTQSLFEEFMQSTDGNSSRLSLRYEGAELFHRFARQIEIEAPILKPRKTPETLNGRSTY
jgi:hypothetical protein